VERDRAREEAAAGGAPRVGGGGQQVGQPPPQMRAQAADEAGAHIDVFRVPGSLKTKCSAL
jgi:hypothetical protein